MNKILPFLIVLMPTVCLGLDDACTKPSEFTIDKRCYVTEEQKKTYPYNTVVALINQDDVYCTGTIISEFNPSIIKRVYTAKHCTDVNDDNVPDETITIKTQDGATYEATNKYIPPTAAYGNYDIAKDNLYSGDWAKYSLFDVPDDLPFTTFTTRHSGTLGKREATAENSSVLEALLPTIMAYKMLFEDNNFNAQVVGYGSLKIMSDKEIQDFKDKYTKFLETSLDDAVREVYEADDLSEDEMQKKIDWYKTDDYNTGFEGDGVYTKNPIVKKFIYGILENALSYDEMDDIFFDGKQLKTSLCQLNVDGYKQGCQSWGGNSGGPIFDKDGRLMGIHTRGNSIIGGGRHAGRDYNNPRNDDGDRWYEKPDGRPDSNIHFLK